jgi:hypothetical protein
MPMAINIACVPCGSGEAPQEVNQLSGPQIAREVASVDDKCYEKCLLKLCPLTRQLTPEELFPA